MKAFAVAYRSKEKTWNKVFLTADPISLNALYAVHMWHDHAKRVRSQVCSFCDTVNFRVWFHFCISVFSQSLPNLAYLWNHNPDVDRFSLQETKTKHKFNPLSTTALLTPFLIGSYHAMFTYLANGYKALKM